MNLLLDTHALLWWLANDPTLSDKAAGAIAGGESRVFVSAATAWEISIKRSLGKLQAPMDLEHQMEEHRFEPLPISVSHGSAAGSLPRHHDDPFDRILVAQAAAEGLTIVTRDARFAAYGVPLIGA